MELLDKTRRINRLLQYGDKVEYNEVAKLLCDVIQANTYIVGSKGEVRGYALIHEFECDIMREEVLDKKAFPRDYLNFIMRVRDTLANIPHENQNCSFVDNTKCIFKGKMTTVVPIYGNGERIGTLIVAKYDATFSDEDLLLAEYAATVLGVQILHDREAQVAEDVRKKAMVQVAYDTLSYSELEAIINILRELNGFEGLLVASKIADRVGITRSVIVNALRKFESAGLIETKSLSIKRANPALNRRKTIAEELREAVAKEASKRPASPEPSSQPEKPVSVPSDRPDPSGDALFGPQADRSPMVSRSVQEEAILFYEDEDDEEETRYN